VGQVGQVGRVGQAGQVAPDDINGRALWWVGPLTVVVAVLLVFAAA
jgi:hypothetical protein